MLNIQDAKIKYEVDATNIVPTTISNITFLYVREKLEYFYPQVNKVLPVDNNNDSNFLLVIVEWGTLNSKYKPEHILRRLYARLPKHIKRAVMPRVVVLNCNIVVDKEKFESSYISYIEQVDKQWGPPVLISSSVII